MILLDCSQEKEQLAQILEKAVAKDYEVVLAGLQFDESILQTADEMKDLLAQMDDTKSPAFLLRNNANTEETRNLLNEHGYTELILYDASLQAGMQENGKPYICYGFFKQPVYYPDYISQVVTAHMPLKGSILKDWYPKFGMREMADNDILFDASKRKEVKAIFQGRGYTVKGYNKSNHDEYEKPPIYNFEMHVELYHKIYDTFNEKYADVKQRLIPDAEVPYRFHFTPEDFYVFVIAHAYKHYSRSGTGIRTLADIYIMNQKLGGTLNWEYVDSELRGLGIFSYEHESRELAQKIFGIAELPTKANLSEAEQQMLAYYLGASTYGTIENRILNQMQKLQPDDGAFTARTKRKYLLSRIFPGREWCKAYAPTVYKYPVLLPFFWVWRLIYKGITNRKKVTQEIKTIKAGKQN